MGVPEHTHAVIALLALIVGVSFTSVSPAAAIEPDTSITPLASTARAVAYLVGLKLSPHDGALAADPFDCTISLTQVRAPLAAKTTSEALARLV